MKTSLVTIAFAAVLLTGCISTLKKLNEPKLAVHANTRASPSSRST